MTAQVSSNQQLNSLVGGASKNQQAIHAVHRPNLTTNKPRRSGGLIASCKAFFARLFGRGERQRSAYSAGYTANPSGTNELADLSRGVKKASTGRKSNWLGLSKRGKRRVNSPYGKRNKKNNLNINNIGRPNKGKPLSQAPPSEPPEMDDIPEMLRKDSTNFFRGRGYQSVQNPSIFVENPGDVGNIRDELGISDKNVGVGASGFHSVLEPESSPPRNTPTYQPEPFQTREFQGGPSIERYSLDSSLKGESTPIGNVRSLGEGENSITNIPRVKSTDKVVKTTGRYTGQRTSYPTVASSSGKTLERIKVSSTEKYVAPEKRAVSDNFVSVINPETQASENTVFFSEMSGIDQTMLQPTSTVTSARGDSSTKQVAKSKGFFSSIRFSSKQKNPEGKSGAQNSTRNVLSSTTYQKTGGRKKRKKNSPEAVDSVGEQALLLVSPKYANTNEKAKNYTLARKEKLSSRKMERDTRHPPISSTTGEGIIPSLSHDDI